MKVFNRSFGAGDVLIILHGLFGISDNWVTMAKKFSPGFRVLIPDLRNHGQSPHSSLFDLPSMEEDILELIEEETAGEPVILMGHSLGGRVAANIALHYPAMIRKLILIDISLRKYPPRQEHIELIEAMLSIDLSSIKNRADVEKQLKVRIHSPGLRQFLMKNIYWRERGRLSWRLNLPAISGNLPAIFDTEIPTGTYPGPVLVIKGGMSDYITKNDPVIIKEKFPGTELVTIPSAGHWVHADAPGEFFTVVINFLTRD
jgi:pimeloyl-ACP methyl ester carboxylesterase